MVTPGWLKVQVRVTGVVGVTYISLEVRFTDPEAGKHQIVYVWLTNLTKWWIYEM